MRLTVEAPYERGEATRARILEVAIKLFGTLGFDSTSTREIAVGAGVPQASLRYYFENKQLLYIACLQHVQAQIYDLMAPALKESEALLQVENATCEQLIDSFCNLQEKLVDAVVGRDDGGVAALLLLRHDLPSKSGANALSGDETSIDRLASCFTQMVVRISGHQLQGESASRLTGLINGQVTNIYLRRGRLLEGGWDITPDRFSWLKNMVRKHTVAILQAHRNENMDLLQ